jgi:ATP-dependent DNA helicase RecQ
MIERWATKLALWLDRNGAVARASSNFGPALRLFGLQRFRDGQLPVVEAALTGKSALVVSPTGFGKTLCFQLPSVLQPGVSVVVSPLKALMGEQVSALLRLKLPATFINSDLDQREKELRYRLLEQKYVKFFYAAPERFFVRNEYEVKKLKSMRPSFLVIDEAHCDDQRGRDFRPEYCQLGEIRTALGSPPVLAFTATAGVQMQQRILASLGVTDAVVFVRGVDRPNISLLRWRATAEQRARLIEQLCHVDLPKGGKIMIFVPTRKIGEALQKYLEAQGLSTPFYHSKLGSAWDREQLVKRFVGESRPMVDRIICTSAFGMGLDVPNVRMVVHWQHPASVEDYLQEFGRAGRDGEASTAILFYNQQRSSNDERLLRFMAERAVESARLAPVDRARALLHKNRQIVDMSNLVQQSGCFRKGLVGYFSGPGRAARSSLATWLLELVFSDRQRLRRKVACCDVCSRGLIRRRGEVAFVQSVLGSRR